MGLLLIYWVTCGRFGNNEGDGYGGRRRQIHEFNDSRPTKKFRTGGRSQARRLRMLAVGSDGAVFPYRGLNGFAKF